MSVSVLTIQSSESVLLICVSVSQFNIVLYFYWYHTISTDFERYGSKANCQTGGILCPTSNQYLNDKWHFKTQGG